MAARSGQRLAIAAERQGQGVADVTGQGVELLAGLGIPKNDSVVATRGRQAPAVGTEGNADCAIRVAAQGVNFFPL